MKNKPHLTVLEGGRDRLARVNSVILKIVADTLSPLPVDVRIFEEDTYLVLTVDPVIRHAEEHPIRLMTKVVESKPNKTGTIVTNDPSWYAIVHDLDNEPTCRLEWIEMAYRQALLLGEIKRVQKMGIPLLGSVHGKVSSETSLKMLIESIRAASCEYLKKILVLVPQNKTETTWKHLEKLTK